MTKRTYEIQEYTVLIEGIEETRNAIVYYDEIGLEVTRELYTEPTDMLSGYVEKSSIVAEQQDEE
jgi:hypothetical protein